jgi:hypothetical protein
MSEVETLIANRKYEAGFSTDIERRKAWTSPSG